MIDAERFLRLSKEGFWIVLGQAIAVVGSLIGVRVLTQLLSPTEYGELALGMTVAALINQTTSGSIGNGAIRFYAPAVEQGDLGGYLKAVRQLVLSVTGGVVFLILATIVGLSIAGRTNWIAIATAALIFAILSGYNSILNGIQNAARQRSIVALHQGIESWFRFLVAAGFLLLFGATSTVAMVGYAIAIIPVLGSQYLFFRNTVINNANITDKEQNWKVQILRYSWPFAAWGIFTWAQQVSDRWALEIFTTTKDVGLYAVIFQLGYSPISRVTGMAMQFLAPIFYQRIGDASDRRRNSNVASMSWSLAWVALGATTIIFLITLSFHAEIFRIFAGKEYISVSYLLPWMILSGGVFAAGQAMSLNLMSQTRTQTMLAPKISTALIGIILNFIGAYLLGIEGIAYASVLFSIIYFIWIAMLSKIETNQLIFDNRE